MKRRRLFRNLTAGATSAGVLSACSRSQRRFTLSGERVLTMGDTPSDGPQIAWRMATSWPENLAVRFEIAQQICNRVGKLTQGGFTITPFPAGGIAPPQEILATVQLGSVECGHTIGYYSTSTNRAFAFAASLPFGLNPHQQLAWLYGAGGLELLRNLYAEFNVINFPAGSSGNQMGGWFRNKVTSVSDMQGLRMRMPGLGGEVLKRIGADAQNMPPREILLGLERGTIDAAEWVGPHEDEQLGINKYVRYYYYPGWHEPGTTYELIINRDAYRELPEGYRKALEVATFEAQVKMLSRYDSANWEALQRMLSSGTELVPYSQEILQKLGQAANDLYAEYASRDSAYRKIYDHWNAFRQGIYRWNRVNERSFADLIFDG
ncbi:MAG: ABC transporter substrate-binding protein [Cyanobacteria bacterium J06636_16]